MARGWESKSVEGQIESFHADHVTSRKQRLSPDQIESARKKNGLLLARSRVLQDLDQSQHSRHREMLKQALADLDAQLAEFEQAKPPEAS
jgi:hypothetical protein